MKLPPQMLAHSRVKNEKKKKPASFLSFNVPCFVVDLLQVFDVLGRLPQISVKIRLRGVWAENETGQKESKVLSTALTQGHIRDWVPVHAEQEYVIIIEISRETFGFKVKLTL